MSVNGQHPVSGRYRGGRDRHVVELRVDVDGPRTTNRVSADYYRDGRYTGSMRVDAPAIEFDRRSVTISGRGDFSWGTRYTAVSVTIARVATTTSRAPARLSHFTPSDVPGSQYTCAFESTSFRTVLLREGRQVGIRHLDTYDTGLMPSSGPRRTLSHQAAFGEAGIELAYHGKPTPVDLSVAGADRAWSDAELQAAMAQYFDRLANRPQWAIWLLHAWRHDDPRLLGLMFDREGLQRQGCAVFYEPMSGNNAFARRNQLHTCVHELGHGFNLLHSWQKSLASPPVPSRPNAVSWMNYPQLYPGGADAFWPEFAFQFDDDELAHLRHALQDDVIMGGRRFTGGAARVLDDPRDTRRNDDLRLAVSAPGSFDFGVPVTIAIELAATSDRRQVVPEVLGPRPRNVDVLITPPRGNEFQFEPLLHHCHGDATVGLRARDGPRRDFAFLHYGRDGFTFPRPGIYRIRARFTSANGSVAHSNALALRVKPPLTRDDRSIARLIDGDDGVGQLLSLTGSGAPALVKANGTLDEIIERFPSHPLAAVARIVSATAVAREFKSISARGRVVVRAGDMERARQLVEPILDLAEIHRATVGGASGGDNDDAAAVADALTKVGTRAGVPGVVDSFINSRRREIAQAIPTAPRRAAQAKETKATPATTRPPRVTSARSRVKTGSQTERGSARTGRTRPDDPPSAA
jgi:hypothetical protein